MNSNNETHFTDEQLSSALGESERKAEEMLKDEYKTGETLDKAKKLLRKIKKLPVIGAVNIPRQSRGLYCVSRSKRLRWVANAAHQVCSRLSAARSLPQF